MIEMRREKRWPIELQLEISSLFTVSYTHLTLPTT